MSVEAPARWKVVDQFWELAHGFLVNDRRSELQKCRAAHRELAVFQPKFFNEKLELKRLRLNISESFHWHCRRYLNQCTQLGDGIANSHSLSHLLAAAEAMECDDRVAL